MSGFTYEVHIDKPNNTKQSKDNANEIKNKPSDN